MSIILLLEMIVFSTQKTQPNEMERNEKSKMFEHWFNIDVIVSHLVLRNSTFHQIEANAFNQKQFQHLNRLDIESVPLEIINKGAFNGLNNLRYIQLVSMKLRVFGEQLFLPLKKLQIFFLRECGEHQISLDNLFGKVTMNNLKLVSIHNCSLGDTITKATFWGLQNVQKLVLVSNKIEKIASNAFDTPIMTLRHLHLNSNRLTSLPKNLFKTRRKDTITIDLKENDWHCDCNMEHFRQFVQSQSNFNFSEIVCKSPPNYRNIQLKHCSSLCTEKPLAFVLLSSNAAKWDHVCSSSIVISRPSFKRPLANFKNGKVHFAIDVLANNFIIIDFQLDRLSIDKHTCRTHFQSDEKDLLSIENPFHSDKMHRICWMKKSVETIIPANCVTIHSYPNVGETNAHNKNVWILKDQMAIMISICILSTIFAFAFGLLVAYSWAKMMRKKSLAQQSSLTKALSEQLRQNEMIERLKCVSNCLTKIVLFDSNRLKIVFNLIFNMIFNFRNNDMPFRRRFSYSRSRHPLGQMPVGQSVSPPLPPRNTIKNVRIVRNVSDLTCCDSDVCECYCEI